MSIVYLGFDPGKNGALSVFKDNLEYPTAIIDFSKIEPLEIELPKIIIDMCRGTETYACLEKVNYMRGDGGKGSFTFGKYTGILKGMLGALGIPVEEVLPQTWKRYFDLIDSSLTSVEKKKKAKEKAIEKFPYMKKYNIGVYDAVLIGQYYKEQLRKEME